MIKTYELHLAKPRALSLREVEPLPTPMNNEVKVDVIYGGICGSDLRVCSGELSYAQYPNKKSLGVSVEGVFAQQIMLESKYVIPVTEDQIYERAILIEPLAVTVHALKKVSLSQETSVAIVGCGNEGLLAAALPLHQGAHITVIDFGVFRRPVDLYPIHIVRNEISIFGSMIIYHCQ